MGAGWAAAGWIEFCHLLPILCREVSSPIFTLPFQGLLLAFPLILLWGVVPYFSGIFAFLQRTSLDQKGLIPGHRKWSYAGHTQDRPGSTARPRSE